MHPLKDYARMLETAREQGFNIRKTRKGHYRVQAPGGGHFAIVSLGDSPRSYLNSRADLRRIGVNIDKVVKSSLSSPLIVPGTMPITPEQETMHMTTVQTLPNIPAPFKKPRRPRTNGLGDTVLGVLRKRYPLPLTLPRITEEVNFVMNRKLAQSQISHAVHILSSKKIIEPVIGQRGIWKAAKTEYFPPPAPYVPTTPVGLQPVSTAPEKPPTAPAAPAVGTPTKLTLSEAKKGLQECISIVQAQSARAETIINHMIESVEYLETLKDTLAKL